MEPYFESSTSDFKLYLGDTMNIINQIGKPCDMIFADPPYFLSKGCTITINGETKSFDKGEWDRAADHNYINEFNRKWLAECRNILKDDGTIWISGTYHNIFSVATCLVELGYKILNIIVWQKTDAKPTLSRKYFSFTTEYIVWARKNGKKSHYFNCDLMEMMNGGSRMTDVWRIPFISSWELKLGKHPTQKPLRLLYRIILSSTHEGDTILDPFAGSCTTGIAANLLGRKFIGIDQSKDYLDYALRRKHEISDPISACKILKRISENPEETMVMVNHARKETKEKMIEKGICYLRAGDSKGSLLVTPGFERMQYVLLHTGGDDCHLFKLKKKGCFQIWTIDSLRAIGFNPEHSPYYIILHFDGTKPIKLSKKPVFKERMNTFRPKIRPLSDFIGIK